MGSTLENLDKLQRMQNRALRVCLNVQNFRPTILLHQESKVSNLSTRRSCNLQKYMFKQKSDMELVKVPVVHTRRHDAVIYKTDKPNIEKYRYNSLYRGAILWNSLTVDVRNIEEYTQFKNYLSDWAHNVTMLVRV